MRKLSFLVATLATLSTAHAAVNVVTTIQTFKVIAEEIGGKDVTVTALVGESVDPHFVDPKPSFALTLNKAALLVHVGLDLEIGWLPPITEQSRNPNIQTAQSGNLDASSCGIGLRDVGGTTSRAQGDIHPRGNPHYWLLPENARKIGRCIADRLKALDGAHAAVYEQNYVVFAQRLGDKQREWEAAAKGLRGTKIVTYHQSWGYLTDWLGLQEIGAIEPKPGVPPDPQHLAQLVSNAKQQGARCVILESFYPRNTAQRVAELGGMKLAVLLSDAGGRVRSYAALMDRVISDLISKCQ